MDETMREDGFSRREFLKRAVAGTAAVGLGALVSPDAAGAAPEPAIPLRVLGKTGVKVSMLGFGGGSRFLAGPEEMSDAILEQAIASGITYFDTADTYGKNRASERRYGRVLPKHRKSIFLAAKSQDRSYDGMMRTVEESLKLMKTDFLDLMQMHAAAPKDDPSAWEKPDGALTALRKLKDQKVIRFIGFTGHDKAEVHRKIIETLEFDTVLMALNAADHKPFRQIALPAAVEKKMGIIAMKTTRGLVGTGPGKASAAELLNWTFDLPISTVIIGMESLEVLNENVRLAREYRPGKIETAGLTERLSPFVTAEQLGWAMPGYRDGSALETV